MVTETKQILDELKVVREELDYIKENMVSIDAILTEGDKKALAQAREEQRKGRTTTLADLKKELGL